MKIDSLRAYHQDLQTLFARHQISLIEHELEESVLRLDSFLDALDRHVRDEEQFLFPAYAFILGHPGASVPMFEAEHRRIESLLTMIRIRVAALASEPSPARILAVLEKETQFKSLLAAHFLREENVLFPALDNGLPVAERDRLLAFCRLRALEARLPAIIPGQHLVQRSES